MARSQSRGARWWCWHGGLCKWLAFVDQNLCSREPVCGRRTYYLGITQEDTGS